MATPGRIAGLAKYLAALSPGLADSTTPSGKKSSARRKRVHILYLINDVLHQTKYLLWDNGAFAEGIRPALPGLFATAMYPKAVKQLAKLERLLAIWDSKQYYPHVFIEELRTAIKDAAAAKDSAAGEAGTRTKQKVQLLPPFHGDPSIPFYDLPAGNLLPLITPNSTAPINSRLVKPVQFASITPEPKLVAAVQDFLTSVDMMFAGQDAGEEPDSVGGFGGIDGEGYYGWSRAFCEQMRQKKKAAAEKDRGRRGSRDRGRESRGRDSERRKSYSSDYSSRSRSSSRPRSRHERDRRSSSTDSRPRRSRRDRSASRSPRRSASPPYRGFADTNPDAALPKQALQQQQQWMPPQQPQMYGFQPQFPQGWVPPPPLPPPGFQVPPQMQQNFQLFMQGMQQMPGMPGMPNMQNIQQAMQQVAAYSQWQQQQQWMQQQQPPPQQQQQQQQPPNPGGDEGYEDYRSIKGRQIGAKRGWKT